MWHAPATGSLFPRFCATVHGHKLCARPTSPRLCCLRSFSTVRSHVWRQQPRGHLHYFGRSLMPELRAHIWSSSESGIWGSSATSSVDEEPQTPGWQEVELQWSGGGLPGWWHEQQKGLVECAKGTTGRTRRDACCQLLDLNVMSHISEPHTKTSRT